MDIDTNNGKRGRKYKIDKLTYKTIKDKTYIYILMWLHEIIKSILISFLHDQIQNTDSELMK